MTTRRRQPEAVPPDLSPEKAFVTLRTQLQKLKDLKGQNYQAAEAAENEYFQLTSKLVMRSFGSESPNYNNFRFAQSAGEHYFLPYNAGVPHALYQKNFEARLQAYESALRSCISELELDLPGSEIRGVYEPGEEYEYYRDITACLKLGKKEIFVIDPYLNVDIFNIYADSIPRTVFFRLLSSSVPPDVATLAQKYAAGGNLAMRTSNVIHDRVLFSDDRVWLSGQSLKDAAKKKPTYIVEHDEPLMRAAYEGIWQAALVLIG